MTGQSSLYSGMSSMGAWGMAAGTMAAAGPGAIGSPSAHSAFGIGSGTAGTGQAQLPIGTSMVSCVDLFLFLWQLLKMPLFLQNFWPGALASEALSSCSLQGASTALQTTALQEAALQGVALLQQSQSQCQLLQSQEGQQGDHQEGSSGHLLHQSQSTPPPTQVTSPSQQDEWPLPWWSMSGLILFKSSNVSVIISCCCLSKRGLNVKCDIHTENS